MFDTLTGALSAAFQKLRGRGTLTEKDVAEALREVRRALLEADVHIRVAKEFVEAVQRRAVGEEVLRSVTPGQQVVKIVHDELVRLMGPPGEPIRKASPGPTVVLLAGLQGSGKTTTAGKLATLLKKEGLKVLLAAADLQRPAAVEQLKILGTQAGVPVHTEGGTPLKVCQKALEAARAGGADVLLLDTAGRLHVDEALMEEVTAIAKATGPHEVLFVCDAMTGQDAVASAKAFSQALPLTGVILTKLDGDARGGAALSVRAVTGAPLRFAGTGEKLDRLEPFHPERMASRILGMGDVVSLVERAQQSMDLEEAARMQEKMLKASFTLEDMLSQLRQFRKMGPIKEILAMLPGMGQMAGEGDEKGLTHVEAVILSMTPHERRHPEVLDGRRKARVARGSGRPVQEVNQLLKMHDGMKRMMKQFKGGRLPKGMKLPPGFPR